MLIFGVYSIIILLLNLNPFFVNVFVKLIGDSVYWRVYWMLPIGFAIGLAGTEIIFMMSNKYKKIITRNSSYYSDYAFWKISIL